MLDTGKAGWNAVLGIVEGVPNLATGTLPGARDYWAFTSSWRAQYDTPLFGAITETLLTAGTLKVLGEIGTASRAETIETGVVQKGGAHGEVKGIPGQESHHAPADSASPLSKNKGPAMSMETPDHRQTASWGNSREARAYRAEQARLIRNGDFAGAQRMDIQDVRSKFGAKYDEAMRQMIEYTKGLGL